MKFTNLKVPFAETGIGRKTVAWTDALIIDAFEYKETGPSEEIEIDGRSVNIGRPVDETTESRVWRLTFKSPIALRMSDENIALEHPERHELPSPYSYATESQWISEFERESLFDRKRYGNLIHIYFVFWNDMIEVLSDGLPDIEEIKR